MIRQYVQRGKHYVPATVSMRSRPTSYHGAGVGCSCLAVTVRGLHYGLRVWVIRRYIFILESHCGIPSSTVMDTGVGWSGLLSGKVSGC